MDNLSIPQPRFIEGDRTSTDSTLLKRHANFHHRGSIIKPLIEPEESWMIRVGRCPSEVFTIRGLKTRQCGGNRQVPGCRVRDILPATEARESYVQTSFYSSSPNGPWNRNVNHLNGLVSYDQCRTSNDTGQEIAIVFA